MKKVKVNIYGYPGDKLPMPQMWGHGHAIARVYQHMFTYVLDTVGGESGAPVFSMMKNAQGDVRPAVFGIHNYGFDKNGVGRDGSDSNACTRINADVFSILKDWQNVFDK